MKKTLLHFLAEKGYYLNNFCARGICKKCKITLNQREILACQTYLSKNFNKKEVLKVIKENSNFLSFQTPKISNFYYGVIDLGTTNIRIGYKKGKRFFKKVLTNPHFLFAPDIFTRITIAPILKRYPLMEYLNLKDLKKGIIVGNPIMYHFLLNKISIKLGKYPYPMFIPKKEVIYPIESNKNIQMVPIISSFIGGDITAGILTINLHKSKRFSLLIDLGTNGEIVLGNCEKIFAVSCAAGPAFEENFHYYGSRVISYLSYLIKEKIIDQSGKLKKKNKYFTQKEIRELQLAKAAIAAGIILLSQISQIPLSKIEKIYLTGNFGANLNIEDLYLIGLLPKNLNGEIFTYPDLPLWGGKKILEDNQLMKECLFITEKTESYFLPEIKDFTEIFISQIPFP